MIYQNDIQFLYDYSIMLHVISHFIATAILLYLLAYDIYLISQILK